MDMHQEIMDEIKKSDSSEGEKYKKFEKEYAELKSKYDNIVRENFSKKCKQ
jgi:predicted nuclease with TOPRIM domain